MVQTRICVPAILNSLIFLSFTYCSQKSFIINVYKISKHSEHSHLENLYSCHFCMIFWRPIWRRVILLKVVPCPFRNGDQNAKFQNSLITNILWQKLLILSFYINLKSAPKFTDCFQLFFIFFWSMSFFLEKIAKTKIVKTQTQNKLGTWILF